MALEYTIADYGGQVNRLVTEDWTEAVDRILAKSKSLTDAEAADRFLVSESTIRRWRTMREAEERIDVEPRGEPKKALLRIMEENGDYGSPFSQDELWLQSMLAPDSLRRMAKIVEGRQVIKGLRSIIADLDWPSEKKRAADRLLTDALLNDEP